VRKRSRRIPSAARAGEDGFALVMVIGCMFVLTLVAVTSLDYAQANLRPSRGAQDRQAALAAAQSGIDDYLEHLVVSDTYWANGNTDSANPAFTSGQVVNGTVGSADAATYTYSVINPADVGSSGRIQLQVTGQVRGARRTVNATLAKQSFLRYLYFSDKETVDPALYPPGGLGAMSGANAAIYCPYYYYSVNGSTARNSYCADPAFVAGDVLTGPVHSNDAILIDGNPGPTFTNALTESSWPANATPAPSNPTNPYRVRTAGSVPNPAGYPPVYRPPILAPPDNSAIQTTAAGGGCLYRGATDVVLNANGTMTVTSPYGTPSSPGCVGTSVPLPANGVLYATASTSGTCPSKELPGGYPEDKEYYASYDCHAGDVFIKGVLHGRLTVAAENTITVVGNTTYLDKSASSTDVLGLISNNAVRIYHPYGTPCTGYGANGSCNKFSSTYQDLPVPGTGSAPLGSIEVDAAIMSVKSSFYVQNFSYGNSLGTLTVFACSCSPRRTSSTRPQRPGR